MPFSKVVASFEHELNDNAVNTEIKNNNSFFILYIY